MAKKKKAQVSVVQQVKEISRRYKQKTVEITDKQQKVITEIMIAVQGYAAFYTPQDTNALINSQYRQITENDQSRTVGRIGYTQSYAAFLHGGNGYMPTWKPAPPGTRTSGGRVKTNWNPDAVPRFLERGADDARDDIMTILRVNNK